MFEDFLEKTYLWLLFIGLIVVLTIFYIEKNKGVGCVVIYTDDYDTYLMCDPVKGSSIGDTIKNVSFH